MNIKIHAPQSKQIIESKICELKAKILLLELQKYPDPQRKKQLEKWFSMKGVNM